MRNSVIAGLVAALGVAFASAPVHAQAVVNRDGVAVIIGNKTYKNRIPSVDFAHNDAEAFKRYVVGVLGFREGNIIDLRDAGKGDMEAVLGTKDKHDGEAWSYLRPGRSDLVVFYSGHGVPGVKDGRGYLLPIDAHPDSPEIGGYPIDVLYENLVKMEAKSVTVYIDACFSGDTPRGMLVRSASPVFVKAELPKDRKGLTVITAAQGQQLASWDEEAKQGLFTRYLLEGLYGKADGDKDGKVTAKEIKEFLDEEMSYAARRQFRRQQQASVQGSLDVVLANVTGVAPPRFGQAGEAPRGRPGAAPAAAPAAPAPAPAARQTQPQQQQTALLAPPKLDPIDRNMLARGSVLVREAPDVRSKEVTRLKDGESVLVLGKVTGENWYYVERGGQALGYSAPSNFEEPEARAERTKKAAEDEARRKKEEEEKIAKLVEEQKRLAAEEERRRIQAEQDRQRQTAAEQERRRREEETRVAALRAQEEQQRQQRALQEFAMVRDPAMAAQRQAQGALREARTAQRAAQSAADRGRRDKAPGLGGFGSMFLGPVWSADLYEGELKNYKRNGPGINKYRNGILHEGTWVDDAAQGPGVRTTTEGHVIAGNWRNGALDGPGVYIWPNGDTYEGQFSSGTVNGLGVLKLADGTQLIGRIVNGRLEGRGIQRAPNGTETGGDWSNGNLIRAIPIAR